jgi:hypothetical protein
MAEPLSLLDCSLELTVGMIAHAATLADERMQEIALHARPPLPGWTRDIRRSCDRKHEPCGGIGVIYGMKHKPVLHLTVTECSCVKYEVVYAPILIPSDRQLTGEDEAAPADPSIHMETR